MRIYEPMTNLRRGCQKLSNFLRPARRRGKPYNEWGITMEIQESRKDRILRQEKESLEQKEYLKSLPKEQRPPKEYPVLIDVPALIRKVKAFFTGKRWFVHAIILFFVIATASAIAIANSEPAEVAEPKTKPAVEEKKADYLLPVKVEETVAKPQPDISTDTPPTTTDYVIQDDDTLWTIAETIYGDGTQWVRIWELNKDVLTQEDSRNATENGHWIHTGQVLQVDT